ncbi:MAG: shikimate kinase [Acidobacteria bacterium]|nr:shikimate kinase [Acidobacteriota bacterium]
MREQLRIFLVGFMGCGKTAVGRVLAGALGVPFVDLDAAITEALGRATIAEIFSHRGEPAFREEESRQLLRVAAMPRVVVATGGGTFCSARNRRIIEEAEGVTVFLDVEWSALMARLPGKNLDRPKFGSPEAASRLMATRRPAYERACIHLKLSGDETPEEVARSVLERVGFV